MKAKRVHPPNPLVCAIILAAGHSRRMGTQKLLLPLNGPAVIERVVDTLLRAVERVLVVVGSDQDRISAALAGRSVEFVSNPDPGSEMLGSLRCGLRRVPEACAGILVALGDQPALTLDTVSRLLAAFDATTRRILVPVWEGRRGHPVLIPTVYREELLTRFDDEGLRGLLRAHAADVVEVSAGDSSVLRDLDTPADLERERNLGN